MKNGVEKEKSKEQLKIKKVALGIYLKTQKHLRERDNEMKRIISLLMSVILALSSMFTLASCNPQGNSKENAEEDSKIYLTLSNYEQYLNVSAKMYGKNGEWSSSAKDYYYEYVTTSVEISSTSPLVKFYNCSISVRVVGNYRRGLEYTNYSVDNTLVISLSLGGTGSNYRDTFVMFSNANNIVGKGYEVISVSGYVVVD